MTDKIEYGALRRNLRFRLNAYLRSLGHAGKAIITTGVFVLVPLSATGDTLF